MTAGKRPQIGERIGWGRLLAATDKHSGNNVIYLVECTLCKRRMYRPIHKLRENGEHAGCFKFARAHPTTNRRGSWKI